MKRFAAQAGAPIMAVGPDLATKAGGLVADIVLSLAARQAVVKRLGGRRPEEADFGDRMQVDLKRDQAFALFEGVFPRAGMRKVMSCGLRGETRLVCRIVFSPLQGADGSRTKTTYMGAVRIEDFEAARQAASVGDEVEWVDIPADASSRLPTRWSSINATASARAGMISPRTA